MRCIAAGSPGPSIETGVGKVAPSKMASDAPLSVYFALESSANNSSFHLWSPKKEFSRSFLSLAHWERRRMEINPPAPGAPHKHGRQRAAGAERPSRAGARAAQSALPLSPRCLRRRRQRRWRRWRRRRHLRRGAWSPGPEGPGPRRGPRG